jgi:hypothetical protein
MWPVMACAIVMAVLLCVDVPVLHEIFVPTAPTHPGIGP